MKGVILVLWSISLEEHKK